MPSIFDGLDNIQQALAAQQFALSITQRNIANVNNPSYTRQEVVFINGEDVPSGIPGVYIQSARNQYLDAGICQELQASGGYAHMSEALSRIEAMFSSNNGQGLQQAITELFGSFDALSSTPEDLVLRQQVLSSAESLTAEFHRIYSGLQQFQAAENRSIPHTVEEINALTEKIATLNDQIPVAEASETGTEFTLRDERQKCLQELSGLMGISYFETESGAITVTTKQGGALVLENQSYELETGSMVASPYYSVQLNGADITSSLTTGKLGGCIQVRDGHIADCLNSLDEMAAALIFRVNEQHALGSDLDGSLGGEFFVPFVPPIPGSNAGAAREIQLSITDPRLIAAASAGSGPGNNENAMSIVAIEGENLFSAATETIGEFYAGLIYDIGSNARTAEDNAATHNSMLLQLKNQQDAVIGVNLDEEAINIVKFQKAYEASARYINTTLSLSDEILRLLG